MSKQSDVRAKYCQRAAGAFMTIPISVSRWDGVALLRSASTKAAERAGAQVGFSRLYVDLLGAHQHALKAVKAKYAAIQTYLYSNTLPLSGADADRQQRGDRMVPVCRMPEVLTKLGKLKADADAAREEFLLEYDRLVAIAKRESLGPEWRKETNHPSSDEVRRKIGVTIGAPRPIPWADISKMSLPAELASELAEAHTTAVADMLEAAKAAVILAAKDQAALLVKQLGEDTNPDGSSKRLHDSSLIEGTKRTARMLRDMVEGYDNDPRLIELAKMLEGTVASVGTCEDWRNNASLRKASAKQAKLVSNGLKAISKADKAAVKTTAKSTGVAAANIVRGGMLADLID